MHGNDRRPIPGNAQRNPSFFDRLGLATQNVYLFLRSKPGLAAGVETRRTSTISQSDNACSP